MADIESQKNNEKQKKVEHRKASPQKLQKCRYGFLAFTGC